MGGKQLREVKGDADDQAPEEVEVTVKVKTAKKAKPKGDETTEAQKVEESKGKRKLLLG